MPDRTREIEIESLKTPKGDVPTIKGLETALNRTYQDFSTITSQIGQIDDSISHIVEKIDASNQKITELGEAFAKIIVYLGKLESLIDNNQDVTQKQLFIEKTDLISLKNDLSSILEELRLEVTKRSTPKE